MEFVFKPEKCGTELLEQTAAAIAKRAELISRKKYPALWEKTDLLNEHKMPDEILKKRKTRRVIYGIALIAMGIFLFVPGIMRPKELLLPMAAGAVAIVFGIFSVLPNRNSAERFEKSAEKLLESINSSVKSGDTVVFGEDCITENGALLMEYEDVENIIEGRSIFFVCDGVKVMVLRKIDLVSGTPADFSLFVEAKTGKETISCK